MSGPNGHWSPLEDERLHEMPWAAQVLYLRGLRRFARDGIVGRTRRISERMLIELLTVPAQRGRTRRAECAPTRHMVRHLLGALQRSGLVEPLASPTGRFVFRLPLVPAGSIRPEDERAYERAYERAHERAGSGHENSRHVNALDGADDPMSAHMCAHMSAHMSAPPQKQAYAVDTYSLACRTSHRARAREPAAIGDLCRRLRREAHMRDANPHRPELVAALDQGIDPDLLVATAVELSRRRVPNVGYLLATVRGRIADSRATGPGNIATRGRMSVCDAIEQQDREWTEREREQGGHLRVVR